ncbi:hypothetical protein BD01_0751 [Thermococcus nautili]|uniref:Uncharacterized protein n=1 Tax=Thermococcus nautili TaxID=195522 RepID=W8NT01_9EURY|nr:hypothetical protein BD01_0751 [Thermococcus nautili]
MTTYRKTSSHTILSFSNPTVITTSYTGMSAHATLLTGGLYLFIRPGENKSADTPETFNILISES